MYQECLPSITTVIVVLAVCAQGSALPAEDARAAAVAAVKEMKKLLDKRDFRSFYQEQSHPHVKRQLTEEQFVEFMTGEKGEEVMALFGRVMRALDDPGTEVLTARRTPDTDDEFEFRLPRSAIKPWHIELQLHEGKWLFMDWD